MADLRVSLSMTSTDPELVARATEHLARAATGMAMDGMTAMLFVGPEEEMSE